MVCAFKSLFDFVGGGWEDARCPPHRSGSHETREVEGAVRSRALTLRPQLPELIWLEPGHSGRRLRLSFGFDRTRSRRGQGARKILSLRTCALGVVALLAIFAVQLSGAPSAQALTTLDIQQAAQDVVSGTASPAETELFQSYVNWGGIEPRRGPRQCDVPRGHHAQW